MKIIRFVISGGIGTGTNLGLLYFFTDICDIWYLYSAILAFLGSAVVSFLLQKFWTFNNGSRDNMHTQALGYFLILLCGLGMNTFILYLLVEYAELHYIVGQLLGSALVAIWSYNAYSRLIFDKAERALAKKPI